MKKSSSKKVEDVSRRISNSGQRNRIPGKENSGTQSKVGKAGKKKEESTNQSDGRSKHNRRSDGVRSERPKPSRLSTKTVLCYPGDPPLEFKVIPEPDKPEPGASNDGARESPEDDQRNPTPARKAGKGKGQSAQAAKGLATDPPETQSPVSSPAVGKETTTPKEKSQVKTLLSKIGNSSLKPKTQDTKDKRVDNAPHLIIEALAGTGKTTTLIEALKILKGIGTTLTPTPQQQAIWDCVSLSQGVARSICFVAFNKSIATELQSRVPAGCEAMTMHSLGFKAVKERFGNVRVESWRVSNIISELLEMDIREIRRHKNDVLQATEKLVGLCKQNLTNPTEENLDALTSHYDVEINGSRSEVYQLIPRVLERCKEVTRDRQIDFNDMIWLPVVLDLPMTKYDLLLIDEFQDCNKAQHALAKKAGSRLILCGDKNQAIYGFAGADSESMDRMRGDLITTEKSCQTLPLTMTRRCCQAVVREAQKIVPEFEAFETNPEGQILEMGYNTDANTVDPKRKNYQTYAQDGDFILCRVNAPLVSQCFRLLKQGRKAIIRGRDIGQGLISTIEKLKACDLPDLTFKLSEWLHSELAKENSKKFASDAKLIALQDRYDCLSTFCEDAKSVEEVIGKISAIFSDNQTGGITLSSIHKAKGLEARRVFFLRPQCGPCPHPMAKTAWQQEQELNLLYVGITRSISELVFVT